MTHREREAVETAYYGVVASLTLLADGDFARVRLGLVLDHLVAALGYVPTAPQPRASSARLHL